MQLLAYNYDKQGQIGFFGFNSLSKQNLCLLRIATTWAATYKKTIYISCSWWQFIYLRYIMRLKPLKRPRPSVAIFHINMGDFIKEALSHFDAFPWIMEDIYDEYYIRRK